MLQRYARNIPALSEIECEQLRTKRIAIIGCGGIGGHLIDQAARIGIGTIRIVDGDCFNESNLNRQLLCNIENLGQSKADSAQKHISIINPNCHTEVYRSMLTIENASKILTGCDLALDALDNIESRRILAKTAAKLDIPVVYGAICGWVAQAAIYLPEEPLMDILYPERARLTDKSVLSFTPALCASMQMSLAVKCLLKRPVSSGTVYYVDLLNQEFEKLELL
ncbi:MAG: ThiF family adenylyltransferase [Peptococcaceae bacterium]|nr:ThiF family adenylyltransferase [Peptococcaceae bacterium]